jgi:hypothetical protein
MRPTHPQNPPRRGDDDDRRGRPGRRRSMFGDLFEGLIE